MDELTESLANSFQVTKSVNTTDADHPKFRRYYKMKNDESNQEKRRREVLKSQKEKRMDYLNLIRNLGQKDTHQRMDTSHQQRSPNRPDYRFKDQLMLSEWMVEVPEEFESDWIMVPCPVGKRSLVIASNGITTVYSKGGWHMNRFKSALPGGNKRDPKWGMDVTILDCIWNELTKTYFILDAMAWKNQTFYDTDTEFRFFWIAQKMEEYPQLVTITKNNQFKFVALPNFSCQRSNLTQVMATPMNTELDGLLFYHKLTHYTFGPTPLVVWLKAYMMPEILQVEIPENLKRLQPPQYTNFADHCEKVKRDKEKEIEKEAKRKEKKLIQRGKLKFPGAVTSEMDTESSNSKDNSAEQVNSAGNENSAAKENSAEKENIKGTGDMPTQSQRPIVGASDNMDTNLDTSGS